MCCTVLVRFVQLSSDVSMVLCKAWGVLYGLRSQEGFQNLSKQRANMPLRLKADEHYIVYSIQYTFVYLHISRWKKATKQHVLFGVPTTLNCCKNSKRIPGLARPRKILNSGTSSTGIVWRTSATSEVFAWRRNSGARDGRLTERERDRTCPKRIRNEKWTKEGLMPPQSRESNTPMTRGEKNTPDGK